MNLLALFNKESVSDSRGKEAIVQRLLSKGHITVAEATVLLKTIDIRIEADKLEMSSGAQIVGG